MFLRGEDGWTRLIARRPLSPFDASKPKLTNPVLFSPTSILPIPYPTAPHLTLVTSPPPITASALERSTPLPSLPLPPRPPPTSHLTPPTLSCRRRYTDTTTSSSIHHPLSTDYHRHPITLHAALAVRFRPFASHLGLHLPRHPHPISRHPGSQSAHLTPSCNPPLVTFSCCVVQAHAALTSAARIPYCTSGAIRKLITRLTSTRKKRLPRPRDQGVFDLIILHGRKAAREPVAFLIYSLP